MTLPELRQRRMLRLVAAGVYSRGEASCNNFWRTRPSVTHAESRERAGGFGAQGVYSLCPPPARTPERVLCLRGPETPSASLLSPASSLRGKLRPSLALSFSLSPTLSLALPSSTNSHSLFPCIHFSSIIHISFHAATQCITVLHSASPPQARYTSIQYGILAYCTVRYTGVQ